MSSQSPESRELLYATLPVKFNSSTKKLSIQSQQFYSKANLSTNFHHSTPSIICSSPLSTQSSSYDTLKELHTRFIKARQSSKNCDSIRQKYLRKESSTHKIYERTKQNQEFRNTDGFDVISESHSRFNNESNRTLGFFDLSPQLTRFYLEGSNLEENNPGITLNNKSSSSKCTPHSQDLTRSASINWQSCRTNLGTLERFGSDHSPIESSNLSTFEKPIRTASEPLLFAMSPLSSEPEWQEGQIYSEEERDDRSDWSSLLDDEETEEVLSNTLLSPIDIPGTKRILPICNSPLSTSASDGSTQLDTLSGSSTDTF